MNNDKIFWELQRTLGAEFSKYLLNHPEMDAKIPDGAQIICHLKDNLAFNAWSNDIGRSQQERNQTRVIVQIDDIAPVMESRLINPHVAVA